MPRGSTERFLVHPAVSVVIPTYNRAAAVRNAIVSVLTQTFSDLEVIVVDDGSTDDTSEVLAAEFGGRIRYHAQANQGVSAARNRGVSEARGQWIAFLDSDDLWDADKIEWQLGALERFGPECGACYTDARLLNHPETRTLFQMSDDTYHHDATMGVSEDALRLLVKPGGAGMVVCICSVLARADAVRRAGRFDPDLRFGEDSEFLFRLGLATQYCYVARPLISIDRTPRRLRHVSSEVDWNKLEFVLQCNQLRLEQILRLSEGLPGDLRRLTRQELGAVHSGLANCHLDAGQYDKAREALSRAARTDLTFNIAAKWLMTFAAPPLARRVVRRRLGRKKHTFPVI